MSENIQYLQRVLEFLKRKGIVYAIEKVKGSKYRVRFVIQKSKNEVIVNTQTFLLAWVCTYQISNDIKDSYQFSADIGHILYEDNETGRHLYFKISQFIPVLDGDFLEEWLELVFLEISSNIFP